MRTSMRWLTVATAALAMACGGSDNGSTGPGNGGGNASFNVDITGDLEAKATGSAAFGTGVDPDAGTVFGIEMTEQSNEGTIQLMRLGGTNPGTGTFAISDAWNGNPGNGEWVAVLRSLTPTGDVEAIFVATSGQVKITASSANAVKGTFEFDATGVLLADPNTELNVAATGSFTSGPATGGLQVQSLKFGRSSH